MRALLYSTVLVAASCGRVDFAAHADAGAIAGADTNLDIDAALACSETPCALVLPQCGCASSQMCQRTGATTDQRGCVARGMVAADDACTADAECAPGFACLLADGVTGRCHRYCAGDTDCGGGIQCAAYQEGVGIGVCGSTCTPSAGCPGGTACKVVLVFDFDSSNPVALPTCTSTGGAAVGSSCSSSLDCAPGLFCDNNVCRALCRFDGMLPCQIGTVCTTPIAQVFLGGIEYGVCR